MAKLKKTLDTKQRRAAKAIRSRPQMKSEMRKGGRPGIDEGRLIADRDALLQLLSSNWERIGWRLKRAYTPHKLRKALMPLNKDQSLKYIIQYFLRTPAGEATAAQIRHTLRLLGEELEKNAMLRENYNQLVRKYDQAESAAANASADLGHLLGHEFNRRANAFEAWERDLVASDYRVMDLEENLADQRSFFSQTELLRFKARGYAHNPKVFANAMAGLPTIGCRQSFKLCSSKASPLWPSYHYEMFSFIESTWKSRVVSPERNLETQFRDAVLRLPRMVPIEKEVIERYNLDSTMKENYVRRFFCENWRFLGLAINQVKRRKKLHSSVVPYLITISFFANYGKPRNAEDIVVAEIEMLTD